MRMPESFPKGYKTLWEKEKLLVTSNFSFSRSVFKRLVLQTRKNQGLFGKGLTNYHTMLHFEAPKIYSGGKVWEKEKLLVTSNFSFSHNVFYLIWSLFFILRALENVVCNLFQCDQSKILSSCNGLNNGWMNSVLHLFQHTGKLTLSQTSPGFYVSAVQVFRNTVGKGEIAHKEQFLLFPYCFLTFWKTFSHVYQISNCRLQTLSTWKSKEFVIWERVKLYQDDSSYIPVLPTLGLSVSFQSTLPWKPNGSTEVRCLEPQSQKSKLHHWAIHNPSFWRYMKWEISIFFQLLFICIETVLIPDDTDGFWNTG